MKFVILTVLCLFRIPVLLSIDMLDCALGRVNEYLCPEDGGWGHWSAWGQCEGECGAVGRQLRTRNCSNPRPQRNGADCDGDQFDIKPCIVPGCSLEQYENLLAMDTVRHDELTRLKAYASSQSALLTKCLSSSCEFSDVSQTLPNEQIRFWNALICVKKNTGCPVSGGWGDWSAWSRCNARCGTGQQMRCRACCDPPPSSPNVTCQGDACEYQTCTGMECGPPLSKGGDWSNWSEWSSCSSTCYFGFTRRTRTCQDETKVSSKTANKGFGESSNYYETEDYLNSDDYLYDDDKDEDSLNDNEADRMDTSYGVKDDNDCYDRSYSNKRYKRSAKYERTNHYIDEYDERGLSKSKDKRITVSTKRSVIDKIEIVLQKQPAIVTTPRQIDLDMELSDDKITSSVKTHSREVIHKNKLRDKEKEPKEETISSNMNSETTKVQTTTIGASQRTFQIQEDEFTKIKKYEKNTNKCHGGKTTETTSDKLSLNKTIANQADVKRTTNRPINRSTDTKSSEYLRLSDMKSSRNSQISIPPEIVETTLKRDKSSDTPKNYGNRINSLSIVLDDDDDSNCEELYKNSSNSSPCKKDSCIKKPMLAKHFGEVFSQQNNPFAAHGSTPMKSVTLSVDNINSLQPPLPTISGKVYVSTEAAKIFPGDIDKGKTSTEAAKIFPAGIDQENISTEAAKIFPTVIDKGKTSTEAAKIFSAGIDQGNVSEETAKLFSAGIDKEHVSTGATKTFPVSNGNQGSRLQQTASTEHFPQRNTPITIIKNGINQGLQTVNTTTPQIDSVDIEYAAKQNTSAVHPTSCDLSKILKLPNFLDLFQAEGCKGHFEELKPCNIQPCNEAGGWSDWSSWSPCSPDCGLGWQVSMRSCTNPEPYNSTQACSGEATRRRTCYQQPCPVTLRTSRAVFMSGESMVGYEALQQHTSVLMLYVRLRHFAPTGNIVTRRMHSCSRKTCDHVMVSIYRSHVLVSVRQQQCHVEFLTNQRISVGDWHEILLTVVGASVTIRVDDSVLTQSLHLSCRPTSPNYDADMRVGGSRFVGEVDRLIVNFKNYLFQKTPSRRDTLKSSSDDNIKPKDSSQVQYEVNSKEVPSVSLSHFLEAPCFSNHSAWNIELAIKPNYADGLVLFMRGYDSRDFLFVSLEQTRIRLRVRVSSLAGECEHPEPVAPQTWIHLGLSHTVDGGGVGLSVNGGPHCVVTVAPPSTEEPTVYCTSGILIGEMPLSVKTVLSSEAGHVEPPHSPLGLLGHLVVDNHTIDLSRLSRKIAPDLMAQHSDHEFRLSSHTAASTVYYEDMLVLQGERLSMPCVFDLSSDNTSNSTRELNTNWYKLDIPVQSLFSNDTGVRYETHATSKAVSLNITSYLSPDTVEGFYSCWVHYPLPVQSGVNIVTYGLLIISTTQDKSTWLFWFIMAHFILIVVLLVLLVLMLVFEAFQDFRKGSGFYRCKKLTGSEAFTAVKHYILSDKVVDQLGGLEAAERAFQRYKEFQDEEADVEAMEVAVTDSDVTTDNESNQSENDEDLTESQDGDGFVKKQSGQKVVVGMAGVEFKSPFVGDYGNSFPSSESGITIKELLQSDGEENKKSRSTADANDNLIDVSERWTHKKIKGSPSKETAATVIGQIQNTSAYRSIKNELKFKHEKFKNLEKYVYSNQNKNDT